MNSKIFDVNKTDTFKNAQNSLPEVGLGAFGLGNKAITKALDLGYRLIDTASQYGNEDEIGIGILNSSVPRSKIILSTKVWTEDVRNHSVRKALIASLKKLKTDYVDLYLIHWPARGYQDAWLEMAKLRKEGLVKSIGVCNFNKNQLEEIIKLSGIKPIVNQIEAHPYFQNDSQILCNSEFGVMTEVWSPLGGEYGKDLLDQQILLLSKKYNKTPAQIILRWHLQRKTIVLPRSSNESRLRSNIDIFDFKLSNDDMNIIKQLDTGVRYGPSPENFDF